MAVGVSLEGSVVGPMSRGATFSCMPYTSPEIYSLAFSEMYHFYVMGKPLCVVLYFNVSLTLSNI